MHSKAFDATGSTNFVQSSEELQEATIDVKPTAPADEDHNGTNIVENTEIKEVEPSNASTENAAEQIMLEELPAGVFDDGPDEQEQENENSSVAEVAQESNNNAAEELPLAQGDEDNVTLIHLQWCKRQY